MFFLVKYQEHKYRQIYSPKFKTGISLIFEEVTHNNANFKNFLHVGPT